MYLCKGGPPCGSSGRCLRKSFQSESRSAAEEVLRNLNAKGLVRGNGGGATPPLICCTSEWLETHVHVERERACHLPAGVARAGGARREFIGSGMVIGRWRQSRTWASAASVSRPPRVPVRGRARCGGADGGAVLGFRPPVRQSRVKNELVGKHCQLKMAVKRSSTILWKWDVPLRPTPAPGGDWALSLRDLRRGGGARSAGDAAAICRAIGQSAARDLPSSVRMSVHCEARILFHFHILIFISASFYGNGYKENN